MTRKDVIELFKRFLIVFVCCIPVLLVITVYLPWHSAWKIVLNCVFVGLVLGLEEYIRYKVLKKRKIRREAEKNIKNKNI